MDISQLGIFHEKSIKISCYVSFVLDFIQLCLATATIIYFIVLRSRLSQLPIKVRVQILLLWTQSLLYTIRNFWMVINNNFILKKETVPTLVFLDE